MATLLLPPSLGPSSEEQIPSDDSGNGTGGGGFDDPGYEPPENSQPDPDRWATPLSACRVAMSVGIVWILTLFAALTAVLEFLRVRSTNWDSIPLPRVLYLNTGALILSSLTVEFARASLRAKIFKGCARWLFITLMLSLAFVCGQIIAWREVISRGFHLASDAGSFCFYLITAVYALYFLGGIIALCFATFVVSRLGHKAKSQTAVGIIALYWHFMDGLWLYVLALLLVTTQG